jgi:hypothetical protein
MADVTGVSVVAVQEPAVEDDPSTDSRGDHHREVVGLTCRAADPAFSERQRLRVVIDGGRQAGQLGETIAEGEAPPSGDVEW